MPDTIYIKSKSEIEIMRQAGRITAGARSIARQAVAAGAARAEGMRSAVHSSSAHSLRIWITSSVMLAVHSAFLNVPILSCVPTSIESGNTKGKSDLGNTN